MAHGGPDPGQFIPTEAPKQQWPAPSYESPVINYSDAQLAGPPKVSVPYTTEAERRQQQMNQQFGTIGTDENGGAIRIMQDNTQYTPAPPIAGPSANTLPPAGAVPNTVPPGGLLDDRGVNFGGYGGRRGGPQGRLF